MFGESDADSSGSSDEEDFQEEPYSGLRLGNNSDKNNLQDETVIFDTWANFKCCKQNVNRFLKDFYNGYEVYQCFNKTKLGYFCTRSIITHPDYMRNMLERDWSEVLPRHLPICGHCRTYYRNNFEAIPFPTDWRQAPKKMTRVSLTGEIFVEMPNFLTNGNFEEKDLPKKRPTYQSCVVKHDSKSQRRPIGKPTNTVQYVGEKIIRAQLSFTKLSPLLKQNRLTYWNQFWYMSLLRENMNYYDQFMEANFYLAVLMEDFKFHIPDTVTEGILTASEPSKNFDKLEDFNEFNYPFPDKMTQQELDEEVDFCGNYEEFQEGNVVDKRKIVNDYHYFTYLESFYRAFLNPVMLEQYKKDTHDFVMYNSNIRTTEDTIYSPSKYFGEWNKSGDEILAEVFINFAVGVDFNNGNVSLAKAHSYMINYVSAYKFMDWVGKFKAIICFLDLSRSTCKINRFPASREEQNYQGLPKPEPIISRMQDKKYSPQATYVLSKHRKVLTNTESTEQMDFISAMPACEFPANWEFMLEHLVKFDSTYMTKNAIEQELMRRHFYCYAKYILKCNTSDKIPEKFLKLDEYLKLLRHYVADTIYSNINEGHQLRVLATAFFPENQKVNYYHYDFHACSVKTNLAIAEKERKEFEKLTQTNAKKQAKTNTQSDTKQKKQSASELNAWSSKPSSTTKGKSSSSTITNIIKESGQQQEEEDTVLIKKSRKFFDSSRVFNRLYFMLDTNSAMIDVVDGKNDHSFNTDRIPHDGESLLTAISYILSSYSDPETDSPSFAEMRTKLVEELLKKVKTEDLYYQSSDSQTLFRTKFIESMREDNEYTLAISYGQRRRGVTRLSEDENEEIELYLKNKLKPEVELTALDAIQLSMCFNMNSVIWTTTDSNLDDLTRTQFHIYADNELHHTWIFVQSESIDPIDPTLKIKNFLIRDHK